MRKVKLDYKLLVFIYAYLRQIDLSIDRARWGYWDGFLNYYTKQVRPLKIALLLLKKSNLANPETSIMFSIEPQSFLKKLWGRLYQIATRSCYLKQAGIEYCCQLLYRFDKFLLADFSTYDFQNETIRIDLISFNYNFLEHKLWPNDIVRATQIEHFHQHNDRSVLLVGEFLRDLAQEDLRFLG
jgi:hypothetical protein